MQFRSRAFNDPKKEGPRSVIRHPAAYIFRMPPHNFDSNSSYWYCAWSSSWYCINPCLPHKRYFVIVLLTTFGSNPICMFTYFELKVICWQIQYNLQVNFIFITFVSHFHIPDIFICHLTAFPCLPFRYVFLSYIFTCLQPYFSFIWYQVML